MEPESPEVLKVITRIRLIKKSILRCADEDELKSYRSQLQREERRLSQLQQKRTEISQIEAP